MVISDKMLKTIKTSTLNTYTMRTVIKGILSVVYILLGTLVMNMELDQCPNKLLIAIGGISMYVGIKLIPLTYHWSRTEKDLIALLELAVLIVLMIIGALAFV